MSELVDPLLSNLPKKTKYLSEEELETLRAPAAATGMALRSAAPKQDTRWKLY